MPAAPPTPDLDVAPPQRGAAPRERRGAIPATPQLRRGRRARHVPPLLRTAGIIEAPELEFTPDPALSQAEREEAIAALRAQGHRVRVVEQRQRPAPVDPRLAALEMTKTPLYGRDDIASATVDGDIVRLVVYGPLGDTDEERASSVRDLERLGRDLARHHGSKAKTVEVVVI